MPSNWPNPGWYYRQPSTDPNHDYGSAGGTLVGPFDSREQMEAAKDTPAPYTHKDFATGKVRRTHGKFLKWSEPTGPLNVRYAIFQRKKSLLCVPSYCLTPETRKRIKGAEDV